MAAGCLQAFINTDLFHNSAMQSDMGFGGGEMIVHWYHIPILDQSGS